MKRTERDWKAVRVIRVIGLSLLLFVALGLVSFVILLKHQVQEIEGLSIGWGTVAASLLYSLGISPPDLYLHDIYYVKVSPAVYWTVFGIALFGCILATVPGRTWRVLGIWTKRQ